MIRSTSKVVSKYKNIPIPLRIYLLRRSKELIIKIIALNSSGFNKIGYRKNVIFRMIWGGGGCCDS